MALRMAPPNLQYEARGCKRCGGDLNLNGDYPSCLQCGAEDYARPLRKPRVPAEQLDGRVYRLRYLGASAACRDRIVSVTLGRWTAVDADGGSAMRARCPFAGCTDRQPMAWQSEGRTNSGIHFGRHECSMGHRVKVLSDKDGLLGWE